MLLLLCVLAPVAVAQRAAAPAHAGRTLQHFNSPPGGLARNQAFRRSSPYAPYTSLPFPFFGDSFDADDIYSTGYPVASQPPAYVLQAADALRDSGPDYIGHTTPYDNHQLASQPLMIELQNGRYVRVSNDAPDAEMQAEAQEPPVAPAVATSSPAPNLAPALLVFRDGHSEEVRDYTIAEGFLYVRGDYYTDGYWNKRIALSSLDVPQTMQANASRNVNFILPSSPNEVITRP